MQFTAETIKEYLKNYHIYRGKIACKTASAEIERVLSSLDYALCLLKYSDEELVKAYYVKKEGSLSDIAKQYNCSKNNIAKKLNRIIEELAEFMSDGGTLAETPSRSAEPPKYTEKQIRRHLKSLHKDITKVAGSTEEINFILTLRRLLDDAVRSLDEIDRTLIEEQYFNKEALSVISKTYGYSVSGVKYRIKIAIKKICDMMNNKA